MIVKNFIDNVHALTGFASSSISQSYILIVMGCVKLSSHHTVCRSRVDASKNMNDWMHLCVTKLRTSCVDVDSISSSSVLLLSLSSPEMLLSLAIANLKCCSGSWLDIVEGKAHLSSLGE